MNTDHQLPTQKLLYTISIYEEDTVLTDHKNADKQFMVSASELQKMFQAQIVLIPEPGLRWMVQDGQTRTCLLEVPRRKDPYILGYRGKNKQEKLLKIFMPAMVFRFNIATDENGQEQINNIHGWCFREKLNEKTQLYEIPLPNFSGSSLCTGSANKKHRQSLRETVEQVVFGSWFNNHLDVCGKQHQHFLDFYEKCQGRIQLNKCKKLGAGINILRPANN